MKFRKKPVVIDAIQFDGASSSADAVIEFTGDDAGIGYTESHGVREYYVFIETLEGRMTAHKGDWIIRGVSGEFYPCKPDIFEKTYEAV